MSAQVRAGSPIGRGFAATWGVEGLQFIELHALALITRWAAIGCLHEGSSALGAELMEDARWLDGQIMARIPAVRK